MTPTLLRLCADMLLTDQEVVTDFGLPVLTDAEVATLNDAIAAHTEAGDHHHVRSSQSEVSTWVLIGACAVMLKRWADSLPAFAEDDRVVAHRFESRATTTADYATDPDCKDRASIVVFLTAEADRLAAASRAARGDFVEDYAALNRYCDGLMAQADDRRSLAAQIERGDDRQGGE